MAVTDGADQHDPSPDPPRPREDLAIRPARPSDAEHLARGEWETARTPGLLVSQPGEIPVEAFRSLIEELEPRGSYQVVELEGRIVAHGYLEPLGLSRLAHIYRLTIVVYPDWRGRGIGTTLLTSLMDWAREQPDLVKVELLVRATNERARHLYRKFGFFEEGRLTRRIRLDATTYIDDICMAWFREGP